jgi:hypothetical protein
MNTTVDYQRTNNDQCWTVIDLSPKTTISSETVETITWIQ